MFIVSLIVSIVKAFLIVDAAIVTSVFAIIGISIL